MVSDYIGLPWGSEHELPWYPPVCEYPDISDRAHLPISLRQSENNPLKVNDFLRKSLMNYVNGGKGEEAEIGQRIITAMHRVSFVLRNFCMTCFFAEIDSLKLLFAILNISF